MKNKKTIFSETDNHLLRKMIWSVIFVLVSQLTFAQAITVKGTVRDIQDQALPGVSILVHGTSKGTITDLNGNFSIVAAPKEVLDVRFIGYSEQNISVGSQTFIKIVMKESAQALDEVVVVGYGVQKKTDVTGAMARCFARYARESSRY